MVLVSRLAIWATSTHAPTLQGELPEAVKEDTSDKPAVPSDLIFYAGVGCGVGPVDAVGVEWVASEGAGRQSSV